MEGIQDLGRAVDEHWIYLRRRLHALSCGYLASEGSSFYGSPAWRGRNQVVASMFVSGTDAFKVIRPKISDHRYVKL